MAILVRVLMLLACGPMLVPPGLCLCHGAAAVGEAARPEVAPVAHRCSHQHAHRKAVADGPSSRVSESPAPVPADDHSPGCPAANASGERPLWVEPPAGGQPLALPAFVGQPLSLAPDTGRPAAFVPRLRPHSPPLYLTHRALLL